jgi:hypothetical protein
MFARNIMSLIVLTFGTYSCTIARSQQINPAGYGTAPEASPESVAQQREVEKSQELWINVCRKAVSGPVLTNHATNKDVDVLEYLFSQPYGCRLKDISGVVGESGLFEPYQVSAYAGVPWPGLEKAIYDSDLATLFLKSKQSDLLIGLLISTPGRLPNDLKKFFLDPASQKDETIVEMVLCIPNKSVVWTQLKLESFESSRKQ